MVRRFRLLAVGGVIFAAVAWLAVVPSKAKDEVAPPAKTESPAKPGLKKTAIKAFMRKKLALSQEIMEGLALEDFDLIEKGARQLRAMSVAAEFMVTDDAIYAEHAVDFRQIVKKLEHAAKEQRLDGATLGFMDMTMNCVDCHKHVRTILIAN